MKPLLKLGKQKSHEEAWGVQRKCIQAWFADYKLPTLQELNFQTVFSFLVQLWDRWVPELVAEPVFSMTPHKSKLPD